jgi:uncharacterized secreted protein with C-terminal beta-propeller domain
MSKLRVPHLIQVFLMLALYALVATQLAACGLGSESSNERDSLPGDPNVFESDDPTATGVSGSTGSGGTSSGGAAGSASGGSSGSSGGTGGGSAGTAGGDPGKVIEEADIIQLEGNTLYALSQYSGLSIIDVSVKDQLKLLGDQKLDGMPFEMYVRDGIVFAMFTSFQQYVNGQWVQSSAVVALDVKNPASIQQLALFTLPGDISDSRLVGDVLYVVAHENGYCYQCATLPRTTVISLDVTLPSQPKKIDELAFDGDGYEWSKRSVMATTDRLYIAGPEYGGSGSDGSSVQIVDISDAGGQLVIGASFEVAGIIDSRWQMDELNGVFRVISQPPSWGAAPRVQTFTVASSFSVTPLGAIDMQLPEPENLRSVRFDGNRAYAITFRQTDPLFTIDLANPAAPKQLGELVIPGWVYHMEPRGNRLLALGYDNTNPEGSLNVSLFDVADMTKPTMLDRVNFGGDWGDFAEDQDRIHKAFTILDELGLIFVPYSGWSYDEYDYNSCGSYESGIKILQFTQDDLVGRGVAPARGRARRAFLHQDRLFGVSDVNVETFDIGNLDAPVGKASLEISLNVAQTIQVGNKIARLGMSYWTERATIDVTTLDAVDQPNSSALIELSGGNDCWYGWYGSHMFANGTRLYVLRETKLHVFDLAGATPVLLGEIDIPNPVANDPYGGYWGYYGYASPLVDVGRPAVNVGDAIVLHFRQATYGYYGEDLEQRAWFVVVDASNPAAPTITTLERPTSIGFNSLAVAAGRVVSTRWEPSPTTEDKVRFYLDRLDLSNPTAPKLLAPINVPGSLVSIRADGKRAITADYDKVVTKNTTADACYKKWDYNGAFHWDYTNPNNYEGIGTCVGFARSARLIDLLDEQAALVDTTPLPTTVSGWDVASGDDRVYFRMTSYYQSYDDTDFRATVVSGLDANQLSVVELEVPIVEGDYGAYVSELIPQGKRLFLVSSPAAITPVDTSDIAQPQIGQRVDLMTYNLSSVSVVGDTAICSLGQFGVSTVDLSP